MMDARIASTEDLVQIWRDGNDHDLRHKLPDTLLAGLDTHGHHVMLLETWGKNVSDTSRPLNHVISGILKLDHDQRPYCVKLSLTDTRWCSLEPWERWHKRIQAEQDEREAMARTVVSPEAFDEIEAHLAEPAGPSPKLREAATRAVALIERKDDNGEFFT